MTLLRFKDIHGKVSLLNVDEIVQVRNWCGKKDELSLFFKSWSSSVQIKGTMENFEELEMKIKQDYNKSSLNEFIASWEMKEEEEEEGSD